MATTTGVSGNDSITGTEGSDKLIGGAGSDTIDGGAGSDFINAGGGDDWIIYDQSDYKIIGGGGIDTLWFIGTKATTNQGQTLNLGTQAINGIEALLLGGVGGHSITFSAADVIRVSHNDRLMINVEADTQGANNTKLFIGSGWSFSGLSTDGKSQTLTNGLASIVVQLPVFIDGFSNNASISFANGADTSVTEDENTGSPPAPMLTAIGSLKVVDPNTGQAQLLPSLVSTTLGTKVLYGSGKLATDPMATEPSKGTLTLTDTGSGTYKYEYSVNNNDVQFLGAGKQWIDSFTVQSIDGTTQKLDFTIVGKDEGIDTSPVTASLTELAFGEFWTIDTVRTVSGSFSAPGIDSIASIAEGSNNWPYLGAFTATLDKSIAIVSWTFEVREYYIDYLLDKETLTQAFTVNLKSDLGVIASKQVSVNLVGATDEFLEGVGSDQSDTITLGGQGPAIYRGLGGNDDVTIKSSVMLGGRDLKVYGEDGDDRINMESGTIESLIRGGNGNDTIIVNYDRTNEIYGDDGDDQFIINDLYASGDYYGGPGSDTYDFGAPRLMNFGTIHDFDFSAPSAGGDTLKFLKSSLTQAQMEDIQLVDQGNNAYQLKVNGWQMFTIVGVNLDVADLIDDNVTWA